MFCAVKHPALTLMMVTLAIQKAGKVTHFFEEVKGHRGCSQ